jgi:hypothetical protein
MLCTKALYDSGDADEAVIWEISGSISACLLYT